ncbi:MAG: NitT/TauT family transport system ATP-binding protein [Actinomycetota bacterium]|nr:NitT/TauT family transport system ATP-binding protein [Actinomycetota bacterium]
MEPGQVSFESLTKVYPDGTHALTPIDLQAKAGELVAIVGPSGCGKSTLLRIASGLEPATSGVARCEGTVGFVFQDATLLPWRSVARNVELGAELLGVSPGERKARVAEAIDLVGLGGFEHHPPAALSGGMRMRVSLARALVLRPTVFLFDEPFGALDEITQERLNEELLRIFQRRPFAGLFVTHNVSEAVFLATRVVVMSSRPGRITYDVDVPFPFPRDPELRYSPAFASLAGDISRALRADGALVPGGV